MTLQITGTVTIKGQSGETQVLDAGAFGLESGQGLNRADNYYSYNATWKAFGNDDAAVEVVADADSTGRNNFHVTAEDCEIVENNLEFEVLFDLPSEDE